MDCNIPVIINIEQPGLRVYSPGQERHSSSGSYPSITIQVCSPMTCCNIHVRLEKQELPNVLCDNTSQRSKQLVDRAACSTFQEMEWQGATQESTQTGHHSSQNDEKYHVSSAFEPNKEVFVTNEKFPLQNVGTPLPHTQMLARPGDNSFGYDMCYPGRIQTEETPYNSGVCVSPANVDGNPRRHSSPDAEQQAGNFQDLGARFPETNCLEHHERNRAAEKRHKCDVCVASFDRLNSLIRHMRTHTGEKPYTCNVCGSSFSTIYNKRRHLRIHTGQKPYRCDVCGAAFARSDSLNCHFNKHTRETPREIYNTD